MKKLILLFTLLCVMLTGCGFAGEAYRNYVTAVLDCTYHADYQNYQKLTNASQLDSEAIYQNQKEALSQRIRDAYGIQSDKISEDLIQQYTELAEKLLKKSKYTIRDVIGNGTNYTVVMVITPIDFWEKSKPDVQTYYDDEFTEKYNQAPTQAAADRLEQEFAEHVLEILTEHADHLNYLEPIVHTFTIENNTISSRTWQEVDELILDLN